MKLINNIDRQTRDSGIELLKIFAIFVIVINHTVQSLTNEAYNIPNNGFVIDISRATTNIQCILLLIFDTLVFWEIQYFSYVQLGFY